MAAQMPIGGILLMHRLVIQGRYREVRHLLKVPKRTLSAGPQNGNENKDERDIPDLSPRNPNVTPRQGFVLRTRRSLSPLERVSRLLPQDSLAPEVVQLREQDPEEPEVDVNVPKDHGALDASASRCLTGGPPPETHTGDDPVPEEDVTGGPPPETHTGDDPVPEEDVTGGPPPETHTGDDPVPEEDVPAVHDAFDTAVEPSSAEPRGHEDGYVPPTLPGERLVAFGELLLAEYRKKGRVEFRKMFQLQEGMRLQSSWGTIPHGDIAGQPSGRFLRTTLGMPILVRRTSLEDYVLYMKRGPAIAYPKDASTMLMMMDVTEGDCVLESGSGSGAMSLFLSRAVGSKGNVLSVELREDHHRRAVLNYSRWRASWRLRRGEEWPDNVHFHQADLASASSLLAGRGFHSVALDLLSPQLVLPAVTPHLHPGAVCAVYLANITQVIDLLEGVRCSALPLLCERIIEVPLRDWLVAPALKKDGRFCERKAPPLDGDQTEKEKSEGDRDEPTTEEQPPFGSVPYIARPHPEQLSHTAFLVKLRRCVQ
ncbi:tRNA (adenine(58)-N(1))-methyltransferase, mitochondrial [Diretmus argenteus]